ncbi:hypothetical protein [Candidatus Amarobacter glycogenicus]|uniref:hypothetical protein n=1 Tax=Candidatus Amarobacter glycogenicus TaxID=3140699 RepID=UPI0031CC47C1
MSNDCSTGRKRLTSPAEGLSVPAKPTAMSGQKAVKAENPRPVMAISPLPRIKVVRGLMRPPRRPIQSVSAAEPTMVAVTIAPIWRAEKPRPTR